MKFKGSDGSALLWDKVHDAIYINYKPTDGLTFNDVAYDDTITLEENLWLYGLHTTRIEALDVYMIYRTPKPDVQRLKQYRALQHDIRVFGEVQQNLMLLLDYVSLGNSSAYGVIAQAQKHLEKLRKKIEAQQERIHDEVILKSNM